MTSSRTIRQTLFVLAFLTWMAFVAGCASSAETSTERTDADTLAAASDSLDVAQPPGDATDSLLGGARASDTLRAGSLQVDTSATGADAQGLASRRDTTRERPTLTNDSLRVLTPQDSIPTGRPSTTSDQRVRVRADSLSARRGEQGERLQELFGNVRVRQDSTRLASREAVRFLDSDEFLFSGDVVIYERGDTLRSPQVRYDRPSKVGRVFESVHLSDGDVDVYSTRAVYYTEEKRSVFPDSVLLVDGDRTLTAAAGVYYSDDQEAEFFGQVQVRDPDTYMEADSVRYFRTQDRTQARGHVFIDRNPGRSRGIERLRRFNEKLIQRADERMDLSASMNDRKDSTATNRTLRVRPDSVSALPDSSQQTVPASGDQTLLWGDRAENDERSKTSRVTGRALLMQVRADSTGVPTDTLFVRSHQLDASRSDSLDRMIAIDSVRIWQPDLAATADSVVYDRFYEGEESSSAQSDSVATAAAGQDVQADDAEAPRASADEEQVPEREETRLFQSPLAWFEGSQVKGDTIRVLVRDRAVDTVFVRSSAFAAQYDSVSSNVQQVTGRTITAVFRRDSIRSIIAQPNARAIRFLTASDGSPNGAAKTSADRIVLRFRDGDVERVSVLSGTETTYYKQAIVPNPFQLDGYIWTPDDRPRKAAFLQEPRVRSRLNLPARTPVDTVGADSTLVRDTERDNTTRSDAADASASSGEGDAAGEEAAASLNMTREPGKPAAFRVPSADTTRTDASRRRDVDE